MGGRRLVLDDGSEQQVVDVSMAWLCVCDLKKESGKWDRRSNEG